MVYNHYANRKGLQVPAMAAFAALQRPEGGGGNYGPNSGGFDQLGFGTLTFTRDPFTLSKEASGKNSFTIYPNPAADNITVTIPADLKQGPVVITLSDVSGKILYKVREKDNRHVFDVKALPAGVYFVTLVQGARQLTGKMVK
jgi:hypothetical protein